MINATQANSRQLRQCIKVSQQTKKQTQQPNKQCNQSSHWILQYKVHLAWEKGPGDRKVWHKYMQPWKFFVSISMICSFKFTPNIFSSIFITKIFFLNFTYQNKLFLANILFALSVPDMGCCHYNLIQHSSIMSILMMMMRMRRRLIMMYWYYEDVDVDNLLWSGRCYGGIR